MRVISTDHRPHLFLALALLASGCAAQSGTAPDAGVDVGVDLRRDIDGAASKALVAGTLAVNPPRVPMLRPSSARAMG